VTGEPTSVPSSRTSLRGRLYELYYGESVAALRFRAGWIVVDLLIIAFFIAAPLIRDQPIFLVIDYAIAVVVAVELSARALAFGDLRKWLRSPSVWVDLFVLATLLFPQWLFNLGFLRVLRLYTLLHSDLFWSTVGRKFDDTRVEDITKALSTMVTFVFVITGFVYTSFAHRHEGINGYLDALYFTVTTLTTTGYGDILLPGAWGRVLSIFTMVVGITLFVRLAQALFRPHKVRHRCPTCGLGVHDPDAVHCKACGEQLNIYNVED
jgi:voltage-gated potassium channel